MKEVEILVKVLEADKDVVFKQLEKFDFKGAKSVLDIYFYDPLRSTLRPNDQGSLLACFRLRDKDGRILITYKNDHYEEGEWLYSDEHEIEVSDREKAETIIHYLGLKKLVEIRNTKYTFETSDFEVVFEDVEGLGLFLEVENVSSVEEDVLAIRERIWNFIQSLGIQVSEEIKIGKPELMLRKNGIAEK